MFLLHECTQGPPPVPPPPPDKGCHGDCTHGGEGRRIWFPGRRLLHLSTGFGCGSCGCH
jgi:hypothetical protein